MKRDTAGRVSSVNIGAQSDRVVVIFVVPVVILVLRRERTFVRWTMASKLRLERGTRSPEPDSWIVSLEKNQSHTNAQRDRFRPA
jgi:hypothetical protein